MIDSLTAAVVQLQCTADRDANLAIAHDLVRRAAAAGARLVALPENSDLIGPRELKVAAAEPVDGAFVASYRRLARELDIWLLLGSFAERADTPDRIHNTSVLIRPDGTIAASYRKIHLFDATPPDGVPYRESDTVEGGTTPVSVDTPLGKLGLSICYDLRFPELYRALDAALLFVPSAFTVPTGAAHWHVLLRARAIENQAFVIAPAQVGEHGGGRRSYGHSLIVDPWGEVISEVEDNQPGFALARLDRARLDDVRRMLPALTHRRLR